MDVHVSVIRGNNGLLSLAKETPLPKRLWAAVDLPRIVHRTAAQAKWADVVYVNSKKALLFGIFAARMVQRPVIWHQRDAMDVPSTLSLRARLSESMLVGLLNRYAARVISVSQATADSFVAAGGRADLPVVIHNGVDPAPYLAPLDPVAVRLGAGLPANVPLVGCFGRLTEWKGQAVLLDALARLPGVHAALVGGPLFGESSYEAALRRQAERLGVAKRVHFLGHRDDVAALMRAMDVVVHTSTKFEPFGRVIVEGMLSERPVVATKIGGVPELVEDGVNGLLVPPKDPAALAAALDRVITDGALADRLAAAGRERALRSFTLDRVVREVAGLIHEVAAKTSH
jgi:glycosyltransferase involved in cell wall biosynthesis